MSFSALRLRREATSAALAKLNKTSIGPAKTPGEKKETPQERLKRIMSKQLTKQSKYTHPDTIYAVKMV